MSYGKRMMKFTKSELVKMLCEKRERIAHYTGQVCDLGYDIEYRDKLIRDLKIQRDTYLEDTQVLSESMLEKDKLLLKGYGEINDLRQHIKFVEQARDKAKAALVEESAKVRKWKVLTAREILEGEA